MRFKLHIFLMAFLLGLASCTHGNSSNDNATITVNGRLEPNATTYTYGTNLLVVSPSTSYFVESTVINPLASFVGDSVQVTMKDMGIRQNPGPELYNIISITPLP